MGVNVETGKPKYKNIRYTANGNQYRKTNIGKIAGTAATTLAGSACLFKHRKSIEKMLIPFCCINFHDGKYVSQGIDFKRLKQLMTFTFANALGVCALVGIGLGGLGDFIANKVKAHKADKEKTGTIV